MKHERLETERYRVEGMEDVEELEERVRGVVVVMVMVMVMGW